MPFKPRFGEATALTELFTSAPCRRQARRRTLTLANICKAVQVMRETLRYVPNHGRSKEASGRLQRKGLALITWMLIATDLHAQTSVSGTILALVPPDDRPCAFASVGGTFYAVARTNPNFPEIYAALLSATLARTRVDIFTTGTTTCGFAEIWRMGVYGLPP